MQTGVTRGIAIVLAIITFIGLIPVAHAAHATNFLDALDSEVTNRVANPGTNGTAQKTLRAANHILGRNTRTLSADLSALAKAATVLNKHLADDATLLSLEEDALAAYSNEAHVELDGATVRAHGEDYSNSIPKRVFSQLNQANNALARFDANSNGVPERARALARVFNKLRSPVIKIFQKFPNPPALSPATIMTSQNLQLEVPNNDPGTQIIYYIHTADTLNGPRHLTYFCNNPVHEEGTWEYIKTGTKTAIVRCTPSSPPGLGVHDFTLTFTTTTVGTFTGVNSLGQSIQGNFFID